MRKGTYAKSSTSQKPVRRKSCVTAVANSRCALLPTIQLNPLGSIWGEAALMKVGPGMVTCSARQLVANLI